MCVIKILKWVAMTINSILLTAGIIVAVFGVVLWQTDLVTYGDKVKNLIPKEMTKKVETPSPDMYKMLGKLVMSFGLFIIGLTILGMLSLSCCSDKCKLCLIIYLIILLILVIVQAAIVGITYSDGVLDSQVKNAIKPLFLDKDKREKSMEFILGTQTFLKCCAIDGYKDYYCADIYDPFCNFGCKEPLDFAALGRLPLCAEGQRKAKGVKKDTGVCSSADSTSAATKSLVRKARETRAERRVHRLRDVYGRAKRETETATETETSTPTYPDEPLYSEIAKMPDSLLKDGDSIITKPSELKGCATKVIEEMKDNLKYVQITCIVILCIEGFLMIVTILLICKQKKAKKGGA